jgi:predicted site-specific integrase-resolvase
MERRGMMLLLKTQVFENAQPKQQNRQKFRFLILANSSQMLFSMNRLFHEFQEEKFRKPRGQSMLIGYARVSTQDQNLELQTEALAKAGCKKNFEDKVSGRRAERPGLAKAQESLREGDTLVVWKLDRLGRSVKNLVDLVGELRKQGV